MDRVTGVQLFIRIVETASFSKAAAEFAITQPTATKAVAAIEQHASDRGRPTTDVLRNGLR